MRLGSERTALPQVAVVQNMPLNDHGNGPAPVGGSHFQPLPTNLAGVGLSGGGGGGGGGGGAASGSPQILTGEAALASLGQGGHTAQGSAKQVTGAGQVRCRPGRRQVITLLQGGHVVQGTGKEVTCAGQEQLISGEWFTGSLRRACCGSP